MAPPNPPVSVAILAGGRSSRMGTDKSFVPVHGRPMIDWVLAAVQGLGTETFLITNRPVAYTHLGLPLFGDLYPDSGPLGGVYTALTQAVHPHVLVVACDMPFLCRDLLGYMLSLVPDYDVVVPRLAGIPEPLHAAYSRACLAPIRARLEAGQRKMINFYADVRVRYLDEPELDRFDPEHRSFYNLNTPEDVIRNG